MLYHTPLSPVTFQVRLKLSRWPGLATLRPANCTQVVNGGRRTNCVGPFPSDLQPICLENREGCGGSETILSPVPPTPPNSKHKPEVDVGVSLPTPRKRELTRNFPEKQKQNRPERWEKPRGKVTRSSRVAGSKGGRPSPKLREGGWDAAPLCCACAARPPPAPRPRPAPRRRFTRLLATIHPRSQSAGGARPAPAARARAEGSRGRRLRPAAPSRGRPAEGRGPGGGGGAGSGSIRAEGAAAGRLTPCRCPGAAGTAPLLPGAAHAEHLPLSPPLPPPR